ncbi:MAG: hypothetical protein ACK55Z_27930, partial [bacterium]
MEQTDDSVHRGMGCRRRREYLPAPPARPGRADGLPGGRMDADERPGEAREDRGRPLGAPQW